jgi:hypothetical protein
MKTSTLIHLLATQAETVDRRAVTKSLTWPAAVGLAASAVLSVTIIGLLPGETFLLPVIWAKFVYGAALVVAFAALLARLYRPGADTSSLIKWPLLVMLLMFGAGAAYLAFTPGTLWADAIFGQTWLWCPWFVLGLSVPALVALLFSARAGAPTRLRATGFTAGVLAGSIGALGYSLACPEMSLAFVAVWYTAGILLSGLLGAVLGPRLLRW